MANNNNNHIKPPGTRFINSCRRARLRGRKCLIISLLLLLVAHQFFGNNNLQNWTYHYVYYISPDAVQQTSNNHHHPPPNNSSSSNFVAVVHDNDDDGAAAEEEEDPFDWKSYTTTCHVLENICRTPNREWFYFITSEENNDDGDQRRHHRRRHPQQPTITVNNPSSKVYIDVSPSIPKKTFSQLVSSSEEQQPQEEQCTVSPIRHHIVTTGLYSLMMGEYYQKIVLPFSLLMKEFEMHHHAKNMNNNRTSSCHHQPSNSNCSSSRRSRRNRYHSSYSSSSKRKGNNNVQLYHHFFEDESRDILPSQELYMNGIPYGHEGRLQSWALTDPSNCTCYHQLVFCGYLPHEEERNVEGWEKNITNLLPYSHIDYTKRNCSADWGTSAEQFTNEGCPTWQDLRTSLLQNYERNYPHLNDVITSYRANLIHAALQKGLTSSDENDDVANSFLRGDISKLSEWRIIGLAQRSDNRHWLNMNETLSQCISQFHEMKIVCVEVDVANLPTNFSSVVSSNNNNDEAIILTEVQEQLILYRSLNALVGIHGSHLTQGVLMPAGSIMMELFQWFPRDWGGYYIWGDGWTNCQGNPT